MVLVCYSSEKRKGWTGILFFFFFPFLSSSFSALWRYSFFFFFLFFSEALLFVSYFFFLSLSRYLGIRKRIGENKAVCFARLQLFRVGDTEDVSLCTPAFVCWVYVLTHSTEVVTWVQQPKKEKEKVDGAIPR